MSKEVGAIIKQIRKSQKLTQYDVAERLFTTAQNISRVENGDGEPTVEMLINLANVFEVSLDTLVGRRNVYESDLFRKIADYIKTEDKTTVSDRIFGICKNILRGRFEYALGEDLPEIDIGTYSAISAKKLIGIYSDREDCPRAFAAMDISDFEFTQKESEAITDFFNALSLPTFNKIIYKIYNVMQERKLYDRLSFCKEFNLEDDEFDIVISALKNCNCIEVNTLFINGQETVMYQPYVSREVVMILQLAKLLLHCKTDGNA